MRRLLCRFAIGIAALTVLVPARAADPPRFEWRDGDRVVLIGDTLIERDQKYGFLETRITAQNPGKSITFRNLGWSGDTVFGHARAGFGKPADGFEHLKEHVLSLKPTVLIVGYGMAESFDGDVGLPGFVSGLNALLDAVTASKPRLILLSPIAHEDLGPPLPDPAKHNRALERYRDAIKKVAGDRSAWFVDLFEATAPGRENKVEPLTDNGIHPTGFGHWYLAKVIDLGLRRLDEPPAWEVRIDREGKVLRSILTKVVDARKTEDGLRFKATGETLPMAPDPPDSPRAFMGGVEERTLGVEGLPGENYTLKIDGEVILTTDTEDWARGVPIVNVGDIEDGPEFPQVEALRKAIVAKNELYFYRWRPQNETYLFGFRKHEQGNNGREIPLFDPLVEEKEKEIARLRKPVPHVYELTRDKEAAR